MSQTERRSDDSQIFFERQADDSTDKIIGGDMEHGKLSSPDCRSLDNKRVVNSIEFESSDTAKRFKKTRSDCHAERYCGVVEGFYGRPWTFEQRKVLFSWMQKMGMNTYMYAPKDDAKHRACWRDLFSVEEAENLTQLIDAASSMEIQFVFAISPGLDMTFSSQKEIVQLKRKLEQVAGFGCKAFALLFDDIETEMSIADKEVFQSFAQAQVSVANEICQHLGQPQFLFCPTEYCAARADPNVLNSEYLNTIGQKLLPCIDIMWTGQKVVSKSLTVNEIKEINTVLCRPLVIWDNIHANDYDTARMFLGPYSGRTPALLPHLNGVLTNPNCEFQSNFVAMHTLAQWNRSKLEELVYSENAADTNIITDIKLETENDIALLPIDESYALVYQPKIALSRALKDWLCEINKESDIPCTVLKPLSSYVTSTVAPVSDSYFIPKSSVESLVMCSEEKMSQGGNSCPVTSESEGYVSADNIEPMEWASLSSSVVTSHVDIPTSDSTDTESCADSFFESSSLSSPSISPLMDNEEISNNSVSVTEEDLSVFVDLFYLPFEHGSCATNILERFIWLRCNAHIVSESRNSSSSERMDKEWHNLATELREIVDDVIHSLEKLCLAANQAFVSDVYPYLWDVLASLSIVSCFISWLTLGHVPFISVQYMQGYQYTWNCLKYRSAFQSGDQEPWCFRGGFQSELKRLLPLDASMDLSVMPMPPTIIHNMLKIRPYSLYDRVDLYQICNATLEDCADGNLHFVNLPDLAPDVLLGNFLAHSPEYCFVLEDDLGICGYVAATLDTKRYFDYAQATWLPSLQQKYPRHKKSDEQDVITPYMDEIWSPVSNIPDGLYQHYPSMLHLALLPRATADISASRRLLLSCIVALKANGSHGVHVRLSFSHSNVMSFYCSQGFHEPLPAIQPQSSSLILVRVI